MANTYPTTELTWQFDVNRSVGSAVTLLAAAKNIMMSIKTSLCSFGTNPWTVVSSSDSTNFGAADYWAADASLTWSVSGNRSWIVLRNTIGAQLCIDLASVTTNAYQNATIAFSPGLGFSGGALNIRPTATDEVVISSTTWGINNAAQTGKLHVWHSTDGYHTRIIYCRANVSTLFAFVDKVIPQRDITWTNPNIACWRGGLTVNQATTAIINGAYNIYGYRNTALTLCASIESYATTSLTARTAVMSTTNAWAISPFLGLWSSDFVNNGKIAMQTSDANSVLTDILYGSTTIATGSGYLDGTSTRSWVQFGNIVLPWNNSTVLIT